MIMIMETRVHHRADVGLLNGSPFLRAAISLAPLSIRLRPRHIVHDFVLQMPRGGGHNELLRRQLLQQVINLNKENDIGSSKPGKDTGVYLQ